MPPLLNRESLRLSDGPWLKTHSAAEELGIHFKTLYQLKKDGFLEPVTHFIRASAGKKAPILWNIEACKEVQARFAAPVRGGRKTTKEWIEEMEGKNDC